MKDTNPDAIEKPQVTFITPPPTILTPPITTTAPPSISFHDNENYSAVSTNRHNSIKQHEVHSPDTMKSLSYIIPPASPSSLFSFEPVGRSGECCGLENRKDEQVKFDELRIVGDGEEKKDETSANKRKENIEKNETNEEVNVKINKEMNGEVNEEADIPPYVIIIGDSTANNQEVTVPKGVATDKKIANGTLPNDKLNKINKVFNNSKPSDIINLNACITPLHPDQCHLLPPNNPFAIGDGYIHLNTCLSGNIAKPPLPERSGEGKEPLKNAEGEWVGNRAMFLKREMSETCHESLPRRRHRNGETHNFTNLRGTSEGILNTVITPPSAYQASFLPFPSKHLPPNTLRTFLPPPLPAKKHFRSKYNSVIEESESEKFLETKAPCLRLFFLDQASIGNSKSEFISNNPQNKEKIQKFKSSGTNINYNNGHIASPNMIPNDDYLLFHNASNSLPKVQQRFKQSIVPPQRQSNICDRDSDGYLVCDQISQLSNPKYLHESSRNAANNATSMNKMSSNRKKKESFKNHTTFNKNINVPDSHNKVQKYDLKNKELTQKNITSHKETRKHVTNNAKQEELRNLLYTTVPLPKKNINRFHSHSNSRSSAKQTMVCC